MGPKAAVRKKDLGRNKQKLEMNRYIGTMRQAGVSRRQVCREHTDALLTSGDWKAVAAQRVRRCRGRCTLAT